MSEATAPLLGLRDAGINILGVVGGCARSLRFWRQAADITTVVVCIIGVTSSVYYLTASASSSVCRPPNPSLTAFHAVLLIVALMLMTIMSESVRLHFGGSPSRVVSLLQVLVGVLVCAWMETCVGGVVGMSFVLVGALMLIGGITFWLYWQDQDEN